VKRRWRTGASVRVWRWCCCCQEGSPAAAAAVGHALAYIHVCLLIISCCASPHTGGGGGAVQPVLAVQQPLGSRARITPADHSCWPWLSFHDGAVCSSFPAPTPLPQPHAPVTSLLMAFGCDACSVSPPPTTSHPPTPRTHPTHSTPTTHNTPPPPRLSPAPG
jgi:hypothetical protein